MKHGRFLVAAITLVVAFTSMPSWAELQNVEIGGEIRIRGRWWLNIWDEGANGNRWVNRVAGGNFPARALGYDSAARIGGIWSRFEWDGRGPDYKYVEQLTALDVAADFTDDVAAVFRLESFDIWGEDFRSNYVTGADMRAASVDDLEFTQAYIEASNMFGYPVRLRIGRQLLTFGKGWLVNKTHSQSRSMPFDAVRLTYSADKFTIDAWSSKLADTSPIEEDGDVDFYGVYGTYSRFEALSISGYWLWVRDAVSRQHTQLTPLGEWVEDLVGVDDYDVTNLHTFGIRLFGDRDAFDYDLELAYQFGNADSAGFIFRPFNGIYGDDDADYDNWGMETEVGYTFDAPCQPRVFVGGVYFEGEDNRDINFFEWLYFWANPFYEPDASVSFTRLFSGTSLASIFDSSQLFTNLWQIRCGVDLEPADNVAGTFQLAYFGVVDEFDHPIYIGRDYPFLAIRPLIPILSFWAPNDADDIGWIATLTFKYSYSQDFSVTVGWDHFFVGDGMSEGNYTYLMGFVNTMGRDDDDADYVYFDARLRF